MLAENKWRVDDFDVEVSSKLEVQDWVRESIIPKLIEREIPAERALLALHYAATWGLKSKEGGSTLRIRIQEILEESEFYSGERPTTLRKLAKLVARGEAEDTRIIMPTKSGRGRYRLFGIVEEGTEDKARRDHVWHYRAIQLFMREGEAAYIAPNRRIDGLMESLCAGYDELEKTGNQPVDVALRQAYIYLIGIHLVHPFIDGNHRAFDRFLEYGFKKAEIPLTLPQDQTGNIPYEAYCRVVAANFTRDFLVSNDLPIFIAQPPKEVEQDYQNKLVHAVDKAVKEKLDNPASRYFYSLFAGELLKYTGRDFSAEISSIQKQAIKEGNMVVVRV